MMTHEAIKLFKDYLHSNHRKRTIESYGPLLDKYEGAYAERVLDSIGSDEIYHFWSEPLAWHKLGPNN